MATVTPSLFTHETMVDTAVGLIVPRDPPIEPVPNRTARRRGRRSASTVLKWPGGKSSELQQLAPLFPRHDRLIDPFVGGGAALFASDSVTAAVNDVCPDLMATYSSVRRSAAGFFDLVFAIEGWWTAISQLFDRERAPLSQELAQHRRGSASAITRKLQDIIDGVVELCPVELADLCRYVEHDAEKSVARKITRMVAIEMTHGRLSDDDAIGNVEGAVKAVVYTGIRTEYNRYRLSGCLDPRRTAYFFFLREYTYAAMFRFNAANEFNVPYGGMSYNRKDWRSKLLALQSAAVSSRLHHTDLFCKDFEVFLNDIEVDEDDFVFLDPPYDSDFSIYDNIPFVLTDHRRLATAMRRLPCPFMLVIKATDAVHEIYSCEGWSSLAFDKTYLWTIKERNDRRAQHLVITNYALRSNDLAQLPI